MTDPKLNYKHYPRSISWQVASVLNPSLQNSLPESQQSKHTREKRERSESRGEPGAHSSRNSITTASKPWQEEESLPLPPQYVSPGALCKAMPKYMRVKARPDQAHYAKPTLPVSASCSPGNLPFSPHNDLALGSPRSDHSSAKLTPRSVINSPKQVVAAPQQARCWSGVASPVPQQTKRSSGAASPASPARTPVNPPLAALVATARVSSEATHTGSAPHQNTPQTQATGSRSSLPHSPSGSRRHSGAQSPRIRSAATSPMHPSAGGSRGVMDTTALQSKLTTIAQNPELQRVVQMHSAAQGSPLSPANSTSVETLRRENYPSSPPVALPPTPPSGRQRRTRNPHPKEPTLETYQKISPNTYATNTVWNDRRDRDSREQTQPRRTILIKSN